MVTGHGLDLSDPTIARLIDARATDPLFTTGAVRAPGGHLSFVYKTAAEIGELGDNTARIRAQIRDDELLRLSLRADAADASVLAHTRWASVGIISEANAHPLNQEELDDVLRPFVAAALNGDVDNYADLKALEGLHFAAEVTTDAKVIPALVARRLERGEALVEAFRATVASFEGSVAIAAQSAADPDKMLLAQRGSGQALYVGFGPDTFVVASEPYGIVAECQTYLRLDGETMLDPGNPASQGQVVVLDRTRAGSIDGVQRLSYDGRELPVTALDVQHAPMTTRDVDRGDAPHYLYKEITEAPASFRKTLRGKIVERDGLLDVHLPAESLHRLGARPPAFRLGPAGAGHRAGDRGHRRAEPGARAARRHVGLAPLDRRVDRHRALGLRARRRHARHARRRDLAVGDDDRHEPHGRPCTIARRPGDRDREPPAERPGRQGRRRALHVRRS